MLRNRKSTPFLNFYVTRDATLGIGKVVLYRLDGADPPEVLFENQDVWGNSAADAEYIYWLSDRAVTRLKKSP